MNPYIDSHPETKSYTDQGSLTALQDAFDEIHEAILWLQELQEPSTDWIDGINTRVVHQDIDGHLDAAQRALMPFNRDRRVNEIVLTLGYHRCRIWPYRKTLDSATLESAIIALSDVLSRSVFTENLH